MSKSSTLIESKEADSKDRPETHINSIDNPEPEEELESLTKRRVVPVKATGETSQIVLTSKATSKKESQRVLLQTRWRAVSQSLLRRRESKIRSRKRSRLNRKRRPKKSFSVLVSMIS